MRLKTRRRGGVGLTLPGLILRGLLAAVLALALAFAGALAYDTAAPPMSMLMLGRTLPGRDYRREYVRLADVSPVLLATVLASEDARFCRNDGVDWDSLREVLSDSDGPSRGASTITMQVAKNLFLWPGRSSLRKGVEIAMALALGRVWSKARTLEAYLNVAEWGDGVFGIEAAAQETFGKPASALSAREAALLATSLPNPKERDAGDPEPFQRRLAAHLVRRAKGMPEWLDCLPEASRYGD